ncbi:MAG TPA: hypothetical protein VK507_23160 [Iamia sp.]|nr:hypothetical protein [Iamia sp.]
MIRRSGAEDFEPWFALFEEVAAEGRWIGAEAPLDRRWARRTFDRAREGDRAVTFLAEPDGRLVGHLGLALVGGCAEIGMMVRDGRRGHGSARPSSTPASPGPGTTTPTRRRSPCGPTTTGPSPSTRGTGSSPRAVSSGPCAGAAVSLWDLIPMVLVLDTGPGR